MLAANPLLRNPKDGASVCDMVEDPEKMAISRIRS